MCWDGGYLAGYFLTSSFSALYKERAIRAWYVNVFMLSLRQGIAGNMLRNLLNEWDKRGFLRNIQYTAAMFGSWGMQPVGVCVCVYFS